MLDFIDIGWRDGDQDVDYRAAAEGGHAGAADVGEVDVWDILQKGSESPDNVIVLGRPICAVFLDGAWHFVVVLKFVSTRGIRQIGLVHPSSPQRSGFWLMSCDSCGQRYYSVRQSSGRQNSDR